MKGSVTAFGDGAAHGEDHGWLGLGEGERFGAFVADVFGLEFCS